MAKCLLLPQLNGCVSVSVCPTVLRPTIATPQPSTTAVCLCSCPQWPSQPIFAPYLQCRQQLVVLQCSAAIIVHQLEPLLDHTLNGWWWCVWQCDEHVWRVGVRSVNTSIIQAGGQIQACMQVCSAWYKQLLTFNVDAAQLLLHHDNSPAQLEAAWVVAGLCRAFCTMSC